MVRPAPPPLPLPFPWKPLQSLDVVGQVLLTMAYAALPHILAQSSGLEMQLKTINCQPSAGGQSNGSVQAQEVRVLQVKAVTAAY